MQADRLSPLIGNRYQLEAQLGRGGMGEVYRATDRLTSETVALKRVTTPTQNLQFATRVSGDSAASGSTNLRMALAQEFRTLASLRHPNIIRVLDYGFDAEHQPYLTMDLLVSPRNLLEAGRSQPLEVKLGLLLQMLQALAYLHRRGVIHRDLKPDNVAVVRESGNDRVRVLDFGLAVTPEGLRAGHAHHDLAGTLAYMAPEVLQGDEATTASDLYAVGVMAFELLAGIHPFQARSSPELVSKVLNQPLDITPLLAVLPPPQTDDLIIVLSDDEHIPSLPEIVDRLLAKHPLDRYRDVQDVINDLCAAVGLPVPTESDAIRESFLQAAHFVGRDEELRQLRGALTSAESGEGSIWLIGGESGVGKSRLLQEIRTRAQISGVLTMFGQSVATGGLPYHLWREPVRRLVLSANLTGEDASILSILIPDIHTLRDDLPADAARLRPQNLQQQLTRLIVDLFRQQREPMLLLLEDLQWAHESLEILRGLAPFVQELPLMILGSFRDDERPTLPDELPQANPLSLKRLDTEEIARLSVSMLGEAGQRREMLDFLQRETEGNAFFLVETVRALAEEGGSLSSVGRTTLPSRLVTGGIRRVIERRLNRVPDWAGDLLRLSAVIGRELDMKLLASAPAAQGIDLEEWLTTCVNRAIFEAHDGGWRFAHDKLREALLDVLTQEQWRDYHRQAAEAIVTAYADGLERYASALAEHYHNAGDEKNEGHFSIIAGQQAEEASDYPEARRLFERALELNAYEAEEAPETCHAELLWRLANTFYKMTEYTSARTYHQQALALYEAANDLHGIANAITGLSEADLRQGLIDQAEQGFLKAQAMRQEFGVSVDAGYDFMNLGIIETSRNNWEGASDLYRRCLEIMEQVGTERDLARALNNYANTLDVTGHSDTARVMHLRALEIRERIHDLHGVCYSLGNLGMLEFDLENYATARPLMERALAISRRVVDRNAMASNLSGLGAISFHDGDYATARGYFEQALELRRVVEDRGGILASTRELGDVARELGDYDDAMTLYRDAMAMTESFNQPWQIPQTLHEIARLLVAQGRLRQALKLLAYVRIQRSRPDHRDDELLNELESRMTPNGYASALASGEALTLPEIREKVAGSLDF